MLFLKYISDLWADHYAEYKKEYGDNEERIRRKLERERFILPYVEFKDEKTGEVTDRFLADFHALYERRKAANLGELINIVLDHIEEANKAKLEGVFRNIDFNSEANLGKTKDRNRRLENLLGDFRQARPAPFARVRGRDRRHLHLPDRTLRLRRRQEGRRVLHAQTGVEAAGATGRAQARRPHLRPHLRRRRPADRSRRAGRSTRQPRLRAVRPGGQRQHLGAGAHEHVPARQGRRPHRMGRHPQQPGAGGGRPPDALQRGGGQPALQPRQMGRPEVEADRYSRFWRGLPPKSKGDYAFITHMIETALPQEGRVAVVVPHGVLFRGGAEGRIRRALIEENLLDAVIGLPGNLFPTTSIPVAILVFDRAREKAAPARPARMCCSSTPAATTRAARTRTPCSTSTWPRCSPPSAPGSRWTSTPMSPA
jgi:type I restriction enzyme M protein